MSSEFWGDLPTWLTTVAVGFAGYQLWTERKKTAREREREEKAQASMLSAWTVSKVEAPRVYGVVIANASRSTFHNVEIQAKLHKTDAPRSVLKVLPPGEYFIELRDNKWEFAQEKSEHGLALRPYTKSDDYRIVSVEFTDNLDCVWRVDGHMVLTRVRTGGAGASVA